MTSATDSTAILGPGGEDSDTSVHLWHQLHYTSESEHCTRIQCSSGEINCGHQPTSEGDSGYGNCETRV